MAVISPVLEEKEEAPRNKQRVRGMTDDQAEVFIRLEERESPSGRSPLEIKWPTQSRQCISAVRDISLSWIGRKFRFYFRNFSFRSKL